MPKADGSVSDRFGRAVAIDDDYAVVGAFADDDHGLNSGSAYVFRREGTEWSQQAKLTASDAISGDSTLFIRHAFDLTSPETVTGLTLVMDYDDAYVAYLGGIEVSRSTSAPPDGPIFFDDVAFFGRYSVQ